MSDETSKPATSARAICFWVTVAVVLVLVFNIWPNLAVSPWNYPRVVAGYITVMILAGTIWRVVRKR